MNKFIAKVQGLFAKKTVEMPVAQKTDLNEKLNQAVFAVLCVVVFFLPLIFVPMLANWFDAPKPFFLLIGTLVAAIIWLFQSGVNKRLNLVRSGFDVPALVFVVISFVSAFLAPNRISSLTSDPIVYTGGFLLFFLVAQTINQEEKLVSLLNAILASGAVLSLFILIQIAASFVGANINYLNFGFNPTSSPFAQALILVALIPAAIGLYLKTKNKLSGLYLVLIVAGLVGTFYVLYKNPPILLGVENGWKISTGTMGRSLTSAIFGMGPGNYVDAFTRYKPAEFNINKYWSLRFNGGANFYFYLLSTVGIAGLAMFVTLATKLFLVAQKRLESPATNALEKGLIGSLAIILAMYFFLPGPSILTAIFFAMLGLLVAHFYLMDNPNLAKKQIVSLSENAWLTFVPSVLMVIVTGFAAFILGKQMLADYYYAQSLQAAAANQGTQTYNLQIRAITLNPEYDVYHSAYSQTNLALADSLASQENLSDQQKSAVIQLVQQSIREARIAAALNPNRASNWENLAGIYRSLINFAQGADQWTVASLNQAIALDPVNPQLRLDLGGLYFAARDYATAGQLFSQATNLKPDFANAHYNLAQALKGLNIKEQAITSLQTAASIVCAGGQTADCDRVNAEILDLSKPVEASPEGELKVATPSAQAKNLQKAKPVAPVKIGTPSGEIQP